MSGAQEERTHRLVAAWEAEAVEVKKDIATLEAQLKEKRDTLSRLESQINSAMASDSY